MSLLMYAGWRLWFGLLAAGLAALLTLGLALAPRADAYVYWVSQSVPSIGRVAEDGSAVNRVLIRLTYEHPPYGVAVNRWGNPPQIFWTWGSWIGRANIDGSNSQANFLSTGLDNLDDADLSLAVNSQYIYWGSPDSWYIGRANIDGSGVNPHFILMPATPPRYLPSNASALVLDNSHIYWTDVERDSIGRANLDGTGIEADFVADADIAGSKALAVETEPMDIFHPNPLIFWASSHGISSAHAEDGSHIHRSQVNPGGGWYGTAGIAWSNYDNRLFWSNPLSTRDNLYGVVNRSPRDGTPITELVGTNDAFTPRGVAVDGVGPVAASPTTVRLRRQRLRTAIRGGGFGGVRARLRAPGSGRVCAELRLRPRAARRLGLRPRGSEWRLGKLVGRRRCLKATTPRMRKLTVRLSRRGRVALRKLLRRSGPRRLARLRRLVRRKGLSVRVRVVWRDALGYRHPTSRPVRLVG